MLVQNLQIAGPLLLQQAFCQVITGDVVPTSRRGCPCSVGYRYLSPNLSLVWGTYSHLSGVWHTLGGIYISISVEETPFFFKGKRVGLLENPLEVTLTYNHQEIDYSFTRPYQSLMLYVDTEFFEKAFSRLLQQPFEQRKQPNLVNFYDQAHKDALVQQLLPLSYRATQDDLEPLERLELSDSIVEQLIDSLEFEVPNYLDRTTCQSLGLKAHEFLLAHPTERVSLTQIANKPQAPLRSIQKGFEELYGLSPVEYHQRYRLLQLRNFIHKQGCEKVGESGKLFGFHHAGRLSKLYKETFGVLPSRDYGLDSEAIMTELLGMTHFPSLG